MSEASTSTPAPANDSPANDSRGTIVMLAGSATTLLALVAVFFGMHHDVNVMGWYANYIIPVGAICVGLLAASGYGIAARQTGLKMSTKLTLSILAELTIAYVLAHYSEYSDAAGDGASLAGFFGWFDASTRAIAFEEHGKVGTALGALGYGVRALELIGFVGGGVLIPLSTAKLPYCDPCRVYKRTRLLTALPAGVPLRKLRKSTPDERLAVAQSAREGVDAIFAAAEAGDRPRFAGELQERAPVEQQKAARKLSAHATLHLQRCPRCSDGALVAQLVTGHGNRRKVIHWNSVKLPPERMQQLFD